MADIDDYEIDGGNAGEDTERSGPPLPRPWRPRGFILIALIALGVAGGGAYFLLRPAPAPAPEPVVTAPPPSPTPTQATPTAPPANLPSLEESDAFVRENAGGLTSHPQLATWLRQSGLVRTLTVVVQNVGEGRSPAPFLSFLRPPAKFQAIRKGTGWYADPRSHAAYDDVADAVASIDVVECVRVYRILEPLFRTAYRELGYPNDDFGDTVRRALGVIQSAPVPRGDIELRQGRAFLEFVDPKLEALSFAQKHVVRMGPRNARLVQAKAAELAAALVAPAG
jgi:Protein of unknown function (DUF3014)